MAIAVDASTPAAVFGTASGSFSPPANSLILVPTASALDVTNTGMTDSQTALTWAQLGAGQNQGGDCEAQIFWAFTTSALTGLTVAPSTASSQMIAPVVLTGASSTQNGPTGGNGSFGALPSYTLARNANSKAGSLIIASIASRSSTVPTFPSGQTNVFNSHTLQVSENSGDLAWVQMISALTSDATTSQTMGPPTNAGYTPEYAMFVAEILPGSGGGSPAVLPPLRQQTNWAAVQRSLR